PRIGSGVRRCQPEDATGRLCTNRSPHGPGKDNKSVQSIAGNGKHQSESEPDRSLETGCFEQSDFTRWWHWEFPSHWCSPSTGCCSTCFLPTLIPPTLSGPATSSTMVSCSFLR